MARSKAEMTGRLSYARKEEGGSKGDDDPHSVSDDEVGVEEEEEGVTDLSAPHVQNSSPEQQQPFHHLHQMSGLLAVDEKFHHEHHQHHSQPYHHEEEHVYHNSYHHHQHENGDGPLGINDSRQHQNEVLRDEQRRSDEADKSSDQCTVEDTHIDQMHQYSVSVPEGVLITIPSHHHRGFVHQLPEMERQQQQQMSNEEDSRVLQMNQREGEDREDPSGRSVENEGEMQHHHQGLNCGEMVLDPHLGHHLQHKSPERGQGENDAANESSTLTHILRQRQQQLLHQQEEQLHPHPVDQNHHHQSSPLLHHEKDISSHIIQHHGGGLDPSFPHIRSPPSPSREFGYHPSLHQDFARTLSAINDQHDSGSVDVGSPLRGMLAPGHQLPLNYLNPPSSLLGGTQRGDLLDNGGGALHVSSAPSITYHHLPDDSGPATPTGGSPVYLPHVGSTTAPKLLGMGAYGGRNPTDLASMSSTLMWSQVQQEDKSSPGGGLLSSRSSNTGHVSTYVPDIGTWSGYDNVVAQNASLQLAHPAVPVLNNKPPIGTTTTGLDFLSGGGLYFER